MNEPETLTLPPLNAEEYRILMAGLGELPCKISRSLANRFEAHIQEQLRQLKEHADAG